MTITLERPSTRSALPPRTHVPAARPRSTEFRAKHLDSPIEYFAGLPYGDWNEVPIPARPAEWRALTVDEEQLLFQQMNLALYRAECLRRDLVTRDDEEDSTVDECREIERLTQRAQSIRDELLHAFHKLNLSLAGRFTNRLNTFDELASEGFVVLLRAIARFNPERGFRFSTYAMHAIRRRMLRFVKSKQRLRLAEKCWDDDAENGDAGRWTLAYEQRITETIAKLEQLLARLSPRERYVLRSRFGWGREFDARTLQQVADEYGVSRERVRQLESRALKKLRAMVKDLKLEI